jgi:hypothetical protein
VSEVNTPGHEGDPFVTADGTTMYFSSDRASGSDFDIFTAVRQRM